MFGWSGDHGHEIEVAELGLGGVYPGTAHHGVCGSSTFGGPARSAVGMGLKAKGKQVPKASR